jgi:hypothetical protein
VFSALRTTLAARRSRSVVGSGRRGPNVGVGLGQELARVARWTRHTAGSERRGGDNGVSVLRDPRIGGEDRGTRPSSRDHRRSPPLRFNGSILSFLSVRPVPSPRVGGHCPRPCVTSNVGRREKPIVFPIAPLVVGPSPSLGAASAVAVTAPPSARERGVRASFGGQDGAIRPANEDAPPTRHVTGLDEPA